MSRRASGGLALLALVACAPDVGAPISELCINEDSDPDVAVSFSLDLADALFADEAVGCADCHTADGATPIGIEIGGLDLSTHASVIAGGTLSGGAAVVAGQPCDSVLVQKLSPAPPFGGRMPLDGPPFVGDGQRQMVHDWIAEGALDN